MQKILDEINLENGSNYKKSVLKKYKDNELLKKLLKMTYDKTAFTYGITMKNVHNGSSENTNTLEWALDLLQNKLATRKITGNTAISTVETILEAMSETDAEIIKKVLDRDLKLNLGRTTINEVFKGLIIKPLYMRCDIYTPKTAKNIKFPAIVQLKADGSFRETSNISGVSVISRSGKSYNYDFEKDFKNVPKGYFHGEMTVRLDDSLLQQILPKLEKADAKNGTDNVQHITEEYSNHKAKNLEYIVPRSISNGLLNSDDVPQENIIYDLWDYVTEEDYYLASLKDKKNLPKVPYIERLNVLRNIVREINNPNIRVIETKEVQNIQEALQFTVEKMNLGLEGAILKDFNLLYKNGTSKQQLKLKVEFNIDVRITGFKEGKKGTKREKTFGSIIYETDDKMIQGSVSGFNDTQLEDFNSRREELIGTVMEIQGNDLTKGRNNSYYAVSHPRFIALRDKDTTDDIERAMKMLESAKCIKSL